MELKSCRIGVNIDDWQLRWALCRLLRQNGASVFCTDDDEEMLHLAETMGLDLAIFSVEPKPELFSAN